MAEQQMCDACGMEFDWPGVEASGYQYCCEACSRGEECTCEAHEHNYGITAALSPDTEQAGAPISSG